MNTAAILTLIAAVLSVEGSIVQVDIGYQDGLQRGDTGLVYFEVAAGSDLISVQVGTGVVVETTENSAAVQVDRSAVVEPGHLVRFDIPERRLVDPPDPRRESRSTGGQVSEFFVASDIESCLNVRPFPAKFAQPLDCLSPGTSVEVIDRMPGWKRARLIDGTVGWVAEAYLTSSPVSPRRAPRPRTPRELPDLDLMRERLESAEAALDASEAARIELESKLEAAEERAAAAAEAENEISGTVFEIRVQLEASSATLEKIRGYRLKLKKALSAAEEARSIVIRRMLDQTVPNLQHQLRSTASALRQAAGERDRLQTRLAFTSQELELLRQRLAEAEISQEELQTQRDRLFGEIESLRASASESADDEVIAELAATLEELEARRLDAERRAIAAEGKNAELEIRLERAEELITQLNQQLDETGRSADSERAPSIAEPLDSPEFTSRRPALSTPPASDSDPPAEVGPTQQTANEEDARPVEEPTVETLEPPKEGLRAEDESAEETELGDDIGTAEVPPANTSEPEDDSRSPGGQPLETPAVPSDDSVEQFESGEPELANVATGIEEITWREENGSVLILVTLDGTVSESDCEIMKVRSGKPQDVLKIRGLERGYSPSTVEVGVGPVERLRTGRHSSGDRSEIHLITEFSRSDVGIQTIQIQERTLILTIS